MAVKTSRQNPEITANTPIKTDSRPKPVFGAAALVPALLVDAEETNARVVIAQGKGRFALANAIAGNGGTEIYVNQ